MFRVSYVGERLSKEWRWVALYIYEKVSIAGCDLSFWADWLSNSLNRCSLSPLCLPRSDLGLCRLLVITQSQCASKWSLEC